MANRLTTAYAGHADITRENAAALLDQFLPQDPPEGVGLGLVLIPERVPRLQKGLKTVIAFLEGEVGADGTIPVDDLIAEMLKRTEYEDKDTGEALHDDLELFLLFDPENEDDVALANAANDAGIPVRNLAAAGDYLVFEEEPPASEQPPWEPDVATTDPARPDPALLAIEQAAADARSAALARAMTPGTPTLTIHIPLDQGLVDAIARAIVAQMANLGATQVAAQSDGQPLKGLDLPLKREDKPAEPVGRTEQVEGSAAFYYNGEKGTYRKARGMSRPGETKVYLTEAEQDEARKAKMLT